ncbi:MAG: hypothetical protein HC812_10980 [Leptolyngbya sp. RL_3_1]|nr:hypothetical protein [Leptolyngbya sp. RL_3_1]
MWDRAINALNLFLMLNIFFVLLSFGWFAASVVGRSFNLDLGLKLWYSLWTPVFQPAIGILMAGAIAVGLLRWVTNKLTGLREQ